MQAFYTEISREKDYPCINITTLDEATIKSKEIYVSAVIDVFNCDEAYVLSAEGGVKVRGNSSAAEGDEKPYRIKFEKKQGMLGLHDGEKYKSWVLLRTCWNLASDYTAFSLARAIFEGEYYSSDCTFVNLYLNGKSVGMYLLCEQNQANEGRVDVYQPKSNERQLEIGYLLEIDNYAGEEHPHFSVGVNKAEFTDINGVTRATKTRQYSIKSDINTEEQIAYINNYTNGVFRILYEATENDKLLMFDDSYQVVSAEGVYSSTYEAINAVMDLKSVVNMFILEELVHNYDVGEGSFFMAVDFSPSSIYKKLTFLAPWDFEWSYFGDTDGKYYAGAYQDFILNSDRSNAWFTMLMTEDWFVDMVKAKWNHLSQKNVLPQVTEAVQAHLQTLRNDLAEDAGKVNSSKHIIKFVNGRIAWLNTQWSEQ